ncbi:hypothetical protein OV079_02895 [Nannocystis pusilla]|uniref:Baseplate protein J-like domain-containing protein n=1 Tax=Nannocystis pusilla TaxID=889268 RepID=A0A9X3EI69_9BACT|nr:hypothetical protein [Nannocystis pusilla]MCY1004532.1 hypothetical protein [Nannocystis pusilla]
MSPLDPTPGLRFDLLRRSLGAAIPEQEVDGLQPLASWAPHSDLSMVLFELWAYVGDVVGLYNGVIMAEATVTTARNRRSLRSLAGLLGYKLHPAVSSVAEVAVLVGPDRHGALPAVAYRSSTPGQVFESNGGRVSGKVNEYTLGSVVDPELGEFDESRLLLDPATASAVRGRPLMFLWYDKIVRQGATEILDVSSFKGRDAQEYVELRVAKKPAISASVGYKSVALFSPSQRAYVKTKLLDNAVNDQNEEESAIHEVPPLSDAEIGALYNGFGVTIAGHLGNVVNPVSGSDFTDSEKKQTSVDLDSVYRSIYAGDFVVVQYNDYFSAHRVVWTEEKQLRLAGSAEPGVMIPVTRLYLNPAIDADKVSFSRPGPLIIHYNMHDVGRIMRLAHTELTPGVVLNTLPLEGIHDKPADPPTRFILEDADGKGVLVNGKLDVQANGSATLTISGPEWDGGLRVPVKAYGNVLDISRGETVQDEVLGDGDPTQAHQTFKLAKTPLTYFSQPGAASGVVSTLEVRVDGILWRERPSFYGAGPNDPVYIVRHDDDQNTFITFGDGVRGLRLPTGRGNVRAKYRHGAGAEAPPAGAINQIIKTVPGLKSVRSPIVARGGGDAETSKDIRRHAPASALVLGRCVSLADFAARTAMTAGVRSCKVEYAWDEPSQTAGIKVWYIPNDPGADLDEQIVADLQAMSEPGTPIRAEAATAQQKVLFLNLEIERDRVPADVESAVRAALLDPERGPLAVENTPIGGPLSRSLIVGAAKSIAGVLDVTSMYFAFDHPPVPFPTPGLALDPGQYLDLGDFDAVRLVVSAYHAESRGCRDLVS